MIQKTVIWPMTDKLVLIYEKGFQFETKCLVAHCIAPCNKLQLQRIRGHHFPDFISVHQNFTVNYKRIN